MLLLPLLLPLGIALLLAARLSSTCCASTICSTASSISGQWSCFACKLRAYKLSFCFHSAIASSFLQASGNSYLFDLLRCHLFLRIAAVASVAAACGSAYTSRMATRWRARLCMLVALVLKPCRLRLCWQRPLAAPRRISVLGCGFSPHACGCPAPGAPPRVTWHHLLRLLAFLLS